MNKDEILKWLYNHLDKSYIIRNMDCLHDLTETYEDLNKFIYFTKNESNQIIVNSRIALYFEVLSKMKELPFKFGHINGNFYINDSSLESFKNFPNSINGALSCINGNFKNGNDWKIKTITNGINICGKNCELEDIDFLIQTNFEFLQVRISDSIFKDNKNLSEMDNYKELDIKDKYRYYEQEVKSILKKSKEIKKDLEECDDYLISFDNKLEMELKK